MYANDAPGHYPHSSNNSYMNLTNQLNFYGNNGQLYPRPGGVVPQPLSSQQVYSGYQAKSPENYSALYPNYAQDYAQQWSS